MMQAASLRGPTASGASVGSVELARVDHQIARNGTRVIELNFLDQSAVPVRGHERTAKQPF
jgi:acetyl-CoA carboxylase beta subunit